MKHGLEVKVLLGEGRAGVAKDGRKALAYAARPSWCMMRALRRFGASAIAGSRTRGGSLGPWRDGMKNALFSVGTLGLSMFVFSAAGHAQAPKEGEKPAAAAPAAGAP